MSRGDVSSTITAMSAAPRVVMDGNRDGADAPAGAVQDDAFDGCWDVASRHRRPPPHLLRSARPRLERPVVRTHPTVRHRTAPHRGSARRAVHRDVRTRPAKRGCRSARSSALVVLASTSASMRHHRRQNGGAGQCRLRRRNSTVNGHDAAVALGSWNWARSGSRRRGPLDAGRGSRRSVARRGARELRRLVRSGCTDRCRRSGTGSGT